jgi:hypothetical protein
MYNHMRARTTTIHLTLVHYSRFLQFKKGPPPSIVSCLELASTPGHPSPSGGSAMSSYSFKDAPFRLLWPAFDTAAMARADIVSSEESSGNGRQVWGVVEGVVEGVW